MAKAFARIKELPAEVAQEVTNLLLGGGVPSQIAAWLHEQGHFKDLKPDSLKKSLERYRASDLKDQVLQGLKESVADLSVAGMRKKIVAMTEMEELVETQRKRLLKVLDREGPLPKGILLKEATEQVRLLKECVTELSKMQLETGVMRRAPKSVSGAVVDNETGQVRRFSWTEEQQRLLQEIDSADILDLEAIPAPETAEQPGA